MMYLYRVQVGDKQLADTSSGLEKAESEIAALQARLCDALSERRHWEDEFLVSISFLVKLYT